jgi:hypothetical protein
LKIRSGFKLNAGMQGIAYERVRGGWWQAMYGYDTVDE